jgi:hypothetical protein
MGRFEPFCENGLLVRRFAGSRLIPEKRNQLSGWQQPANWVLNLTNCNWQLEIMILTPVRNHCQLMVVSSPGPVSHIRLTYEPGLIVRLLGVDLEAAHACGVRILRI